MGGIDKEVVKVWVAPTKRQRRCGCHQQRGSEGVCAVDEEAAKVWVHRSEVGDVVGAQLEDFK